MAKLNWFLHVIMSLIYVGTFSYFVKRQRRKDGCAGHLIHEGKKAKCEHNIHYQSEVWTHQFLDW